MTFKPEVSVGDVIASASFLVAALALFLTLYQLRRDAVRKRAEFIVSVFNQYITDPETSRIFYQIEYDQFSYGSDFHGSEQELHLDRLLSYFEKIAALYRMGALSRADLELVRYEFLRVHRNRAVQEYFAFLDKHPDSLGMLGGAFRRFRDVAAILEDNETADKAMERTAAL